jgi:GNAT superfamily N-acetyltransferase
MGRPARYARGDGRIVSLEPGEKPEPIPVTVTFLEMTAPPKHYPPAPMNRHMVLLRARNPPVHFYRYLIDRVGRKWHWVNALRMDPDVLQARLNESDRDIRVLYLEGSPGGFFETRPVSPGVVELVFFGLMERAMGQGIGRWFLGAAIEAAWSQGPQRVMVQTCTLDHPAALPLYQKLGFSPVGQQQASVLPLTLAERAAILVS